MTLHAFYPTRADGLCETFQCFELLDGASLESQALTVLEDHPSAAWVDVYDAFRKVLYVDRAGGAVDLAA